MKHLLLLLATCGLLAAQSVTDLTVTPRGPALTGRICWKALNGNTACIYPSTSITSASMAYEIGDGFFPPTDAVPLGSLGVGARRWVVHAASVFTEYILPSINGSGSVIGRPIYLGSDLIPFRFVPTEEIDLGSSTNPIDNIYVKNLTIDPSGGCSGCPGGGGALPVVDTTSIVTGSADVTKQVRIEADSVSTGTTRVWTAPDYNLTVAGKDVDNAFTAGQTTTVGFKGVNVGNTGYISGNKVEVHYSNGGSLFWYFSLPSFLGTQMDLIDNAGTSHMEFYSSTAPRRTDHRGNFRPLGGGTYTLGDSVYPWLGVWTGYIEATSQIFTSANIWATGNIRSDSAFQLGGSVGISATFDPNTCTSLTFAGGILVAKAGC